MPWSINDNNESYLSTLQLLLILLCVARTLQTFKAEKEEAMHKSVRILPSNEKEIK